jgi:hypothetical protein
MVACVIEELSFKRKVKVVSSNDVALKPLMDRLKRSVSPPHIIPVAIVLFKVMLSLLGNKTLSFVSTCVALNLLDIKVSTIALLAVIEPLATTSPVIATMKGITSASCVKA